MENHPRKWSVTCATETRNKTNVGEMLILICLKHEEDERKQEKQQNSKGLLGSQVIRFQADSMEDVLQR